MALRTPLYDWHLAHHAAMVEFGGWDMPIRYSTITEEHTAVRTDCGLFDISHMGRLSFPGAGALDLIQHVWTNNAATMKDMQVRYGLICNEQGGIRDDVLVYRMALARPEDGLGGPYGWAMVVNASNRTKIVAWLDQHRRGVDATIDDRTESSCMVAVQGPKALALCAGMFPIDLAPIKYYFAAPTEYRGQACVVSRTGYTGEDGLEIMVPRSLATTLADDLLGRGAKPCGLGARDTLRLEAAMPLYGHELTEETDPLQAGLSWAVKLDKGDFIGREAILARQKDVARPVRVGLELEGKRAAREGAIVLHGDRAIGRVTSGTFTPTLNKAIAMAYVSPAHAAVGANLEVEVGRSRLPGRVVSLPFYSRAKK
jgi:aminomethyltransferase